MPERPRRRVVPRLSSQMKALEDRLTRLEGQLKLLRSQAPRPGGTALSSGRLNVKKIVQAVEPSVTRSLAQSKAAVRAAAKETRRLGKGLRAGVKAGTEAYRRSRRG